MNLSLLSSSDNNRLDLKGYINPDIETLIIGERGWNECHVKLQLDLRTGKSLKVYTERMLLAFLGCGKDPFNGSMDLLLYFTKNHPGLEFIRNLGFRWPSTDVFPGVGHLPEPEWPKVGLLGCMGYRVGEGGAPRWLRHQILSKVFEGRKLPQVESREYMSEWGTASSDIRLRKLAESIASFARLRKGKDRDRLDVAIKDWEDDLDWLKAAFYTGRFRFQWPNTQA